jgi:hypothetical protein
MIFLGIFNGVLREFTYGKQIDELHAHQVSTAIGMFLFGLYIWMLTHLWSLESAQQAIAIGVIWLVLTVLFEFTFGHFVAGHSWRRLLKDYNILAGRVWSVVLIWIAIAPWLFYHF